MRAVRSVASPDDDPAAAPADPAARGRGAYRPFGWVVGALSLGVAALLILLVVLVHRSAEARDRALQRTERSFAVVLLANDVGASLARAEAALGRFVISSDRGPGTTYYDEWRHAGEALRRLAGLVGQDAVQTARLRRLQELYVARGRELALAAARAGYRQGWPALSLYYQAGRSPTLPRIQRLLRAVTAAETARLDRRANAAAARGDHSNDLTRLLSVAGVALALMVVGLAALVVRALMEQRVARANAESEADRAVRLAQAVAERTAELSTANERLRGEAHTRAEAEAKLRQVQKMDAVGQLTGGIAHDFNNMLAVVLGGLEMARRRVEQQAMEATRHIDSAMEGAERAAALTRRLLAFARQQPLLPAAVEPGRLLLGMSDLLDRTLGERIELRILADADVWPVWIDAYQLENAVLNLAVNARDAMAGAGTLRMTAANVRLAAGEAGTLAAGDYVRIAVTDTGAGMPDHVVERVFEPFFTTKPVGQGTGLGLSQTLGFARQSGGDVSVLSRAGEGTTVSILLPRHRGEAAAAPAARAPEPARPPVHRGGRALLAEDDDRVREATAAALTELGWEVVACASGPEALARLDVTPDIDLLMSDVVMPGMTGPDLVAAVRRLRPGLPVLMVTGYTGDANDAELFRGAEVLRKPFTLRALASAVARATAEGAEQAA